MSKQDGAPQMRKGGVVERTGAGHGDSLTGMEAHVRRNLGKKQEKILLFTGLMGTFSLMWLIAEQEAVGYVSFAETM